MNVRNYLDCRIVSNQRDFVHLVNSNRFSNFKELGSGFVAVFLKPAKLYLKQAFPIGFTILERSKGLIFDHYYNIIKPALNGKVSVLFSDTDSLLLKCVTHLTVDEVMQKLSSIMDFSNLSKDHPLYDSSRMNELTFWKNETQGEILAEFVGLCAKTYSIRVIHKNSVSTHSKAKGVGSAIVRRTRFEEYKKCIDSITSHRATSYDIRSRSHVVTTLKSDRLCWTSFDNKRFLSCPIHSMPYGSIYIKKCLMAKRCLFCKPK